MKKPGFFIALLVLLAARESIAQGNPSNGNNGNTSSNGNAGNGNPNNGNRGNEKPVGNAGGAGVPIDGGASALLAAGVAFSVRKLKQRRSPKSSTQSLV